jgi:hypothetical protein
MASCLNLLELAQIAKVSQLSLNAVQRTRSERSLSRVAAIAANVALQHGDNKTFGKLTASPRNAGPFMKGAQMIASARALAKQGVPMS